ncbi:hypothetical protein ACFQL3_17955 [Natronoarchaeum sp. GCM10025321]
MQYSYSAAPGSDRVPWSSRCLQSRYRSQSIEAFAEGVEPHHVPTEYAHECFGVEFTTLEGSLREHGWEDKDGMASV